MVGGWVHRFATPAFPWGTLVVNVSGCLLLGALMGTLQTRGALAPEWRTFGGIGVLGGYTTFSTLSYETVELMRRGQLWQALANGAGSLVAGCVAVIAGVALVRWLLG
jgi:fluoride exporter